MSPQLTPVYVSIEHAAHRLGIGYERARQHAERGLGVKSGGRWFVDQHKLEKFAAAREQIEAARAVITEVLGGADA